MSKERLINSVLISILPNVINDNYDLFVFILVLSNIFLLVHWASSTSWDSKFNWCSFIISCTAIFHLHYSNVTLIYQYEPLFVSTWIILFYYHTHTFKNNYQQVYNKIIIVPTDKGIIASLRPYKYSLKRFLIKVPIDKYANGEWKEPTMGNAVHVFLIIMYACLLYLHFIPFITPFNCLMNDQHQPTSLCCRYNYAINGYEYDSIGEITTASSSSTTTTSAQLQSVNRDFCSGRVRIAFVGSWSTGKTSIINALLGHEYSTSQIAPAPTTDKFVCLALGSPYSGPIASDDYEQRKHCEIMSHMNDITHKHCYKQLPNVVDVADSNTEFEHFVFFDTPGWQSEYRNNCEYESFYRQLIDKMDFVYVVWDLSHGMIEDYFADFFKSKTKGVNYEIIYNRFEDGHADMAFLNQQYSKMTNGQEILSEMYTMKLHENNTLYRKEYEQDLKLLRSKIMSVNQTVYDNRKKMMKNNLMTYKSKVSGMLSLRKLKLANSLIQEDLNIHIPPKRNWMRRMGFEL